MTSGFAIVVMGVSGAGKSTVGRVIAQRLKGTFVDADDLHPAENVAKMEAGIGLTDEDRWPWLESVGKVLADASVSSSTVVVACSALRRKYRDALRESATTALFVHLDGAVDLLRERVSSRQDHFMPPALLRSQLETLEPLGPDENGLVLNVAETPEGLAEAVLLHARSADDSRGRHPSVPQST